MKQLFAYSDIRRETVRTLPGYGVYPAWVGAESSVDTSRRQRAFGKWFPGRVMWGCLAFLLCTSAFAQNGAFWKEDFSAGKLPDGWTLQDNSQTGKCAWMVTDQPYPGSFQFNQQQPPIASTSRGFHMQYRPGVVTGDEVTKWNQRKQYPDASFQTAAIDCRGKDKVLLRFEHNFRWNNWFTAKNAGLYVGVSNDGKTWKEFNVTSSLPAATSVHTPVREELNITEVAGNQATVYLRFAWRGIFSWFWMVDDIELCEPLKHDVAITALTSHKTDNNTFTDTDTLRVRVKNMGAETIARDLQLTARIDGTRELSATLDAAAAPLAFNEEREVAFPVTSLKGLGSHKLTFHIAMDGDERTDNNTFDTKLYASKMQLGKVTGFKKLSSNEFEFTSNFSKAKLIFYRDDIFRLWLAPDGEYTNPAGDEIVVDYGVKNPSVSVSTGGDYYRFTTRQCVVRVYKNPMRIALYGKDNRTLLFEEEEPITFGTETYQTLKRAADEDFYGGGMQQGSFSHAGKTIDISVTGWDDKQASNPVPFYMSTKGYGVFRNTFAPGKYSFDGQKEGQRTLDGMQVKTLEQTSRLTHFENRFDAFYFYGPSLKNILNDYTDITGKPFMPAMWMLTLGDADCYNNLEQRVKWEQHTPDVIWQIADEYIKHDMPRGWILPNDGYGCGYTKLDSVVTELKKRGFHTGLWTENGVDKIAYEVGTCGTRLCKLDVAWIGSGYDFALNGCKSAFEGIQNNSNERGFVWSVCGWAGTQRYSTVWSGDQYSNWNYIRYHIPTVTGAGLSGFNAATSDIDGIFGGSARTYTRDLQWKCFTPIMMVMSGWSDVDKQPWLYGHPYETINRDFLRLKMRLLPYLYSYCREAHETGVPTVRAMVLEFPEDQVTHSDTTQYQFMSGEWLLVAPVYKPGNWREQIYFPEGNWYDYWNGTKYEGGKWLPKYEAKLDRLPVFVREGAIIPMYPYMDYVGQKPVDVLTLELWPSARKTSFTLYEDDFLTRDHEQGAYAKTVIDLQSAKGQTELTIHAAKGDFKGRCTERTYLCNFRLEAAPAQVKVNGRALPQVDDAQALEAAQEGFCYDAADCGGRLMVKTGKLSADNDVTLIIN